MPDGLRSQLPILLNRDGHRGRDVWTIENRLAAILLILSAITGCGSEKSPPEVSETPPRTASTTAETATAAATDAGMGQPSQDDAAHPPAPAAPPPDPPPTPEQREAEAAFRAMTAEGVSAEDVDAATDKLLAIGSPAAAVLAAELQSDDSLRREMAATMLVQLGADASSAKEQLIMALKDESNFVRANAATALAQMEGGAKHVISTYDEFLGGDDPILRNMMASNLSLLDATEATPLLGRLIALLQADDSAVQLAVVELLGRMGADAASAVDALQALEATDNDELKAAVAAALAEIEKAAGGDSEPKDE